ncbi:MAG: diguanylate cyclase domain-containing protein [Armatimonadota bacterium]
MRAVVYAPPERHRWVRWALGCRVSEMEFVRRLEEIAGARAELVVLAHELVAAEPEGTRAEVLLGLEGAAEQPLRIIVGAPDHTRATWLQLGADIAVGEGTSALELGAMIGALLRRAGIERDRSPLTGLPGNVAMRRYLRGALSAGRSVAVVMADIDDFKAFNDRRGHLAGDRLILLLAEALRTATATQGGFLSHVGGDDFCVVCEPEAAEPLMEIVAEGFARDRAGPAPHARPAITIVRTDVAPGDASRLEDVFRRLAMLRVAARSDAECERPG